MKNFVAIVRTTETEEVYRVQSEPCFNVELEDLLKKVESNYLSQVTDSQTSISQSLAFHLE